MELHACERELLEIINMANNGLCERLSLDSETRSIQLCT